MSIADVSSRNMTIVWDPPLAEHQNGIIRLYIVDISVEESGENYQMNSVTTSLIVSDLHPYYSYSIGISAVTIGQGPQSDPQSIRLLQEGIT